MTKASVAIAAGFIALAGAAAIVHLLTPVRPGRITCTSDAYGTTHDDFSVGNIEVNRGTYTYVSATTGKVQSAFGHPRCTIVYGERPDAGWKPILGKTNR